LNINRNKYNDNDSDDGRQNNNAFGFGQTQNFGGFNQFGQNLGGFGGLRRLQPAQMSNPWNNNNQE